MNIQEGKTYYFYDNRAVDGVCKAHVLHILPHPDNEDDRLIVYRWYGKHKKRWWYGVTTISQQELWADYIIKVLARRKGKRIERITCGKCGYFMRYVNTDGTPNSCGDCGSISMNKECFDGINPFREDDEILQVDENEQACGFFKVNQTRRVRKYIQENPTLYYRKRKK